METLPWLAPLKQFVLVWFFLIFTGAVLWTYARRDSGELERFRHLPLESRSGEAASREVPMDGEEEQDA